MSLQTLFLATNLLGPDRRFGAQKGREPNFRFSQSEDQPMSRTRNLAVLLMAAFVITGCELDDVDAGND